jgi:flotillin
VAVAAGTVNKYAVRSESVDQLQCARISVMPFDFSLSLQAMTIEKLQFSLPAVFTIGPEDKLSSLKKYALLLSGKTGHQPSTRPAAATEDLNTPTTRNHVQDIVKGIIEGETRVIVSSMTMEEIFKERQIFKSKVISNVQNELEQFGLKMYIRFCFSFRLQLTIF